MRLLLLTGQRRNEIADLRWAEIEDGAIVLPKERTKNSREHVVPLSPQALAVLDEQAERVGRERVFGDGEGGFSGFSKARERLDEASGVAGWTLHDLRRTAATRMADLGVQPHVVESILNHISGHKAGVSGIYNGAAYAAEKAPRSICGVPRPDLAGEATAQTSRSCEADSWGCGMTTMINRTCSC